MEACLKTIISLVFFEIGALSKKLKKKMGTSK